MTVGPVEYSKGMERVFVEATASIIKHEENLGVLLTTCGLSQRDMLPPWIPTRRRTSSGQLTLFVDRKAAFTRFEKCNMSPELIMVSYEDKYSGYSEAVFDFDGDVAVLRVPSEILGMISEVDEYDNTTNQETHDNDK